MKKAATIIFDKGAQHVIIKGGKALDQDKSYDLYYDGQTFYQLTTDMFQQSYNHGAGCTFAAAITASFGDLPLAKYAVVAAANVQPAPWL
ncbi:bifunctional hydroxymethylpyrimidine kinase/phosphomethylpyrimidine kinase [Staphylococcus aureus]|uniref:bifunctional hydroxymethylpyrimidine kinase/phosphomethylpyrimidine kinase n=1 Tax=Staphylococcus aureus TaxID=1280 RepID=UPI003D6781FF